MRDSLAILAGLTAGLIWGAPADGLTPEQIIIVVRRTDLQQTATVTVILVDVEPARVPHPRMNGCVADAA